MVEALDLDLLVARRVIAALGSKLSVLLVVRRAEGRRGRRGGLLGTEELALAAGLGDLAKEGDAALLELEEDESAGDGDPVEDV